MDVVRGRVGPPRPSYRLAGDEARDAGQCLIRREEEAVAPERLECLAKLRLAHDSILTHVALARACNVPASENSAVPA